MANKEKKPTATISLVWSAGDVKNVRPHLTREQVGEVLDEVLGGHDASMGVCWQTIEEAADSLFPHDTATAALENEWHDAPERSWGWISFGPADRAWKRFLRRKKEEEASNASR